jgi:hypothetical protein
MLAWRGKNFERRTAVSEHDEKRDDADVEGHKFPADRDEKVAEPDVEGHKLASKLEEEPDVEGHQLGQVSAKHEA